MRMKFERGKFFLNSSNQNINRILIDFEKKGSSFVFFAHVKRQLSVKSFWKQSYAHT